MCAVQFQAMLACWAASGDLRSNSACKTAADTFMLCLKTTVRPCARASRCLWETDADGLGLMRPLCLPPLVWLRASLAKRADQVPLVRPCSHCPTWTMAGGALT